ncbi:uncharacterized protein STEHIDRAFT_126882 [Stereum hirsutum FP-91666 SS1]|uniref:uncharacterized protein n=1 Tax=Stereum hirsutum (strain FP-91666) TaxID=721885 RepID=UPI000440C4C2|nr:uncharacterized protein STEHIDRAFT_126882 [Stereum hirsutum FP-91666 SS1]EIM91991.1 hypothetical protein STEHIDRAFT_126882 [Stereum hirsutum FP-91666 SS1]
MSSAAARAEARRKAILSRGSDRLSKLTTSARGEDAPAYAHDEPPSNLSSFLGEDTPTPTSTAPRPRPSRPNTNTSTPTPGSINPGLPFDLFGGASDPSAFTDGLQQQFMQALMGGMMGGTPTSPSNALPSSASSTLAGSDNGSAGPSPDDPLMALMNSLQAAGAGGAGGPDSNPFAQGSMANPFAAGGASDMFGKMAAAPKPKTMLQRLLPLIHVLSMWCLVAFFVIWKEPEVWAIEGKGPVGWGEMWRRWAELGRGQTTGLSGGGLKLGREAWGVQVVPFFWAFVSLELALHSLHIFSGLNTTQPPMLLMLALPHLPKPLPTLVLTGLKYIQMGSTLLDDIAAVLVALGLLVAVSGWLAG